MQNYKKAMRAPGDYVAVIDVVVVVVVFIESLRTRNQQPKINTKELISCED